MLSGLPAALEEKEQEIEVPSRVRVRQAVPRDAADVASILHEAAQWLDARGRAM
jgi:hypothetical protein